MRVVNEVDNEYVGTHIDVGNSMMLWEEPIEVVKKMAPKAVSSHFKDHIVVMPEDEPMIIRTQLGKGCIDLLECYRILDQQSPLERINIEVCYGYIVPFRIPEADGIGGKLGQGCFNIIDPSYNPEVVAPYINQYLKNPYQLNAFSWSELAGLADSQSKQEELIVSQDKAVLDSVNFVKRLKQETSLIS
jgi:3-oxoisoapionate decarboxylase